MQSYKSLHPNHVHQLTVSVSKHYWVTKEGVFKYQAKPLEVSLDRIDDSKKIHLIHYVIRDHTTGVVYAEAGLSNDLIPLSEFLFRAWSEKKDFAFCGIPELMTIPKTVEKAFPNLLKAIALLGIRFPQVTSGFQAGVGGYKNDRRIHVALC